MNVIHARKKGHYLGAAVCKKKHSHATRKVDASDGNGTDSDASDLSGLVYLYTTKQYENTHNKWMVYINIRD